jgi:hypothetical protein
MALKVKSRFYAAGFFVIPLPTTLDVIEKSHVLLSFHSLFQFFVPPDDDVLFLRGRPFTYL